MVINHLLNGMILQVGKMFRPWVFHVVFGEIIFDQLAHMFSSPNFGGLASGL